MVPRVTTVAATALLVVVAITVASHGRSPPSHYSPPVSRFNLWLTRLPPIAHPLPTYCPHGAKPLLSTHGTLGAHPLPQCGTSRNHSEPELETLPTHGSPMAHFLLRPFACSHGCSTYPQILVALLQSIPHICPPVAFIRCDQTPKESRGDRRGPWGRACNHSTPRHEPLLHCPPQRPPSAHPLPNHCSSSCPPIAHPCPRAAANCNTSRDSNRDVVSVAIVVAEGPSGRSSKRPR